MPQTNHTVSEREARQNAINEAIDRNRARKDEAFSQSVPVTAAPVRMINGLRISSDIVYGVPCTVPGYEHLKVYFRTNNPTSLRYSRPDRRNPPEWYSLNAQASNKFRMGELDDEYNSLLEKMEKLSTENYAEYKKKWAVWASQFVKLIEGWDFGKITGYDEVTDEPIAEATPRPILASPTRSSCCWKSTSRWPIGAPRPGMTRRLHWRLSLSRGLPRVPHKTGGLKEAKEQKARS
jgi:hypothetical protein